MTNLTNASSTQLKAALALSEKREAEAAAKAAKAPKNYSKPFSAKQVPWAINKLMVSSLTKADFATLANFVGIVDTTPSDDKAESDGDSSSAESCVGLKWEGQTRETVCGLSEISGELDGAKYCTKHYDRAKGTEELGQTLNGNDVPVAPSYEELVEIVESYGLQTELALN
jgi:hypothetical protein